jgi:hypothetical protein
MKVEVEHRLPADLTAAFEQIHSLGSEP